MTSTSSTPPNVAHSTPFPTVTKQLEQRIEGNGLTRHTLGTVNGRHPRRTTMGRLVLLSISNLCIALAVFVGSALYTAHTAVYGAY
jgi:hypothetical protein